MHDPALESSEVAPSPAGEPIQSKFFYVPGDLESCRECSAEIVSPAKLDDRIENDLDDEDDGIDDDDLEVDELDVEDEDEDGFYTERYDTVMEEDSIGGDEQIYGSYTGEFHKCKRYSKR